MKSTLKETEPIHYVSNADIINFINENSDMERYDICDFVNKNNIVGEEGQVYWTREAIFDPKQSKNFNIEAVYWLRNFFNVHPWIKNMMVVFDD